MRRMGAHCSQPEYEAFVVDTFPLHFAEVLRHYPHSMGGNASFAAAYLATDLLFTCANRAAGNARSSWAQDEAVR